MRTVEEVRKYLAKHYRESKTNDSAIYNYKKSNAEGKSIYIIFKNTKLSEGINNCLTKLWNDEEIVDAVPFSLNNPNIPVVICLTNKVRMFIIREVTVTSGSLITFTDYTCTVEINDLKDIDTNKCRMLEQANTSFFGKPKPSIYGNLILNDRTIFSTVDLVALKQVYEAILNNIKTYRDAPKVSAAATKEITPPASNNIAEIRKLYEDGIITKEEMLDLIKALGKK